MAELTNTSEEPIGSFSSKTKISMNESGIGHDASIVVDINHSVGDESGIGKDLCCNSFCEDSNHLKTCEDSSENFQNNGNSNSICEMVENSECSKNGVIKETGFEHSGNTENGVGTSEQNIKNDGYVAMGMKKEDSGIDIQRSPGKDGASDLDISESQSESGAMSVKTDSGVALSSQSKLSENDDSSRELNDSGQVLDENGSCDVTMPSVDEIREIESDSSSEEDDEVVLVRTKKTRRRRRSNRVDSSTEENSDENEDTTGVVRNQNVSDSDSEFEVDSKKSEESESSEEEVDESKNLNETFKPIKELRDREYGYSKRRPLLYFREKVQASATMVKRFKLESKLDYHDGCVNALHFNRIGMSSFCLKCILFRFCWSVIGSTFFQSQSI